MSTVDLAECISAIVLVGQGKISQEEYNNKMDSTTSCTFCGKSFQFQNSCKVVESTIYVICPHCRKELSKLSFG